MPARECSRRGFLRRCAVAAIPAATPLWAATASAQQQPPAGAENLTHYQIGPHIWLRWNNEPLTCYRAHPTQKYPYFYPLTGPLSGLSLTSESAHSVAAPPVAVFRLRSRQRGQLLAGRIGGGTGDLQRPADWACHCPERRGHRPVLLAASGRRAADGGQETIHCLRGQCASADHRHGDRVDGGARRDD